MFCSYWLDLDHSVAPPALLCHKEPAQGTESPSKRQEMPLVGGFGCLELVLYGIRDLVEQHYDQDPTNQSKPSIFLDQ